MAGAIAAYSIKNMIFSKTIPSYVIPVPIEGHQVYSCTDCGDRFLFESSAAYHSNRKSMKIIFNCSHCSKQIVFYNRCNLLCHIRTHVFKTATISLTDLIIEPLTAEEVNLSLVASLNCNTLNSNAGTLCESNKRNRMSKKQNCLECESEIPFVSGMICDRANHYKQGCNDVHICPLCLYVLPTLCALKAHIRLHQGEAPYLCPECGKYLASRTARYPFNHACEGFKMMRMTARIKCPGDMCLAYHPSHFNEHMKTKHIKVVYKCSLCVVACFSREAIHKHMNGHRDTPNSIIIKYYQCQLCPGRLVLAKQLAVHILGHISTQYVYPCWGCNVIFNKQTELILHYQKCPLILSKGLKPICTDNRESNSHEHSIFYRVTKRCETCKCKVMYKCRKEEIDELPTTCPFSCLSGNNSSSVISDIQNNENATNSNIICPLCQDNITGEWNGIKLHYLEHHKEHRCLDIKVQITKLNVTENVSIASNSNETKNKNYSSYKVRQYRQMRETRKRKRRSRVKIKVVDSTDSSNHKLDILINNKEGVCIQCGQCFENKNLLEAHIVLHRDLRTAYQCLECGLCFMVKPSFSTHLLVSHGIDDVEDYIQTKKCYNEEAFLKNQTVNEPDTPLNKNQCKICKEQFSSEEELDKHFRVHGMAFLMTNKIHTLLFTEEKNKQRKM